MKCNDCSKEACFHLEVETCNDNGQDETNWVVMNIKDNELVASGYVEPIGYELDQCLCEGCLNKSVFAIAQTSVL